MSHMPALVTPPGLSALFVVSVKDYGAKGDGVTDDAAAIQSAVNAAATAGQVLFFPKGRYRVNSTIIINDRCRRIVGEFPGRNSLGGTEIQFFGTGPCIQIGTDDGVDWNASHYGGVDSEQDQWFENIYISHGAPDTNLVSTGGVGLDYKAGAYGIWDWYGGGLMLRNVGIERFEANFVGIQSDINNWKNIGSFYSKYGIYIGPRSDQFTICDLYSFYCDRAVTIDGAGQTRLVDAQLVFCGTSTASAVEIRRGSAGVCIERAWLERTGGGYTGSDQPSFVSAGEIDGYGAGGSISSPGGSPNTNPVEGVSIRDPFCYTVGTGLTGHTKYVATVGKCRQFVLDHPTKPPAVGLSNFDALVAVPAGQSPTSSDTQVFIEGFNTDLAVSKIFTNLGGGSPAWHAQTRGTNGVKFHGASAVEFVDTGNLTLTRNDAGSHATRPVLKVDNSAVGGGFAHRADIELEGEDSGGTTRTVVIRGEGGLLSLITANNQNLTLNAGTGTIHHTGAFATALEIAPPQITANQDNYNPTGMSSAAVLLLTSDAARDVTGFATGVGGRWIWVYNTGAFNVTLKHQVTSSAANQIRGRGGADTVLTPSTGVQLYYSPSLTKWVVMTDTL